MNAVAGNAVVPALRAQKVVRCPTELGMTAAGQPGTRMRPSCETILAMACARMTVGLASKPATGMMAAVANGQEDRWRWRGAVTNDAA